MFLLYINDNYKLKTLEVTLEGITFCTPVIEEKHIVCGFYANGRKYVIKSLTDIEVYCSHASNVNMDNLFANDFQNAGRKICWKLEDLVQLAPCTEPSGDDTKSLSDFIAEEGSTLVLMGVGGVITTKALLAAEFSFTEAEIESFVILNNNVYAVIQNDSYTQAVGALPVELTSLYEGGALKECGFGPTLINVTSVNALGLEDCKVDQFYLCAALESVNLPKLKDLENNAFRSLVKPTMDLDLSAVLTTTPYYQFRNSTFNNVNLSALTELKVTVAREFICNELDIRSVVLFGADPSVDNDAFAGSTITKIYAHNSMATNNAGGPDATLQYMIGRGTIVEYI